MNFNIAQGAALVALIVLLSLTVMPYLGKILFRHAVNRIADAALTRLLSDKYSQNLAEMLPSLQRFSILNTLELSLRAETGTVLARPLGSPKQYLGFENIVFSPPQLTRLSLPVETSVDMSVVLGRNAAKPLTIRNPLMISSMAYGLALSEEARIALCRAAQQLQTAVGSGEGPVLPAEQDETDKYILQISRWSWGDRTYEQVCKAAMLEVQMGQGGDMGAAMVNAQELAGRARILAGLQEGQPAISLPSPPGVNNLEDWPDFIASLRERANGIPLCLKIMATDHIEKDLEAAIRLGFDAIAIDGAQGGAHASPAIKQDDFGIPSLHALIRARRYLQDHPMSLIVSGGYFTPGQCLKALALGADAIYLGTVPLFALAHGQVEKTAPFEPITTLVYYDSPSNKRFNIDKGMMSVVNTLTSMNLEMEEAMRGLGKRALCELNASDLAALDTYTAEVTGLKRIF